MPQKKKKSDKGNLARKHLEYVSCKDYKLAPKKRENGSGIYVLYDKRGRVYYVGMTKSSLRTRIRNHHLKDRHAGKWDFYSCYQILDKSLIKDFETILIRVCEPYGNLIKGRLPKKYNLNKAVNIK